MRLLHSLAKTHASFDDPNLVSHAGLVPVMALARARRAGGPGRGARPSRRRMRRQRAPEGPVPGRGHGGGRGFASMTWVRHEAHCLYRPRSGRGPEEVSVGLMAYLDP